MKSDKNGKHIQILKLNKELQNMYYILFPMYI